jgi:hypothetical protein
VPALLVSVALLVKTRGAVPPTLMPRSFWMSKTPLLTMSAEL